ncbi:MAG: thioredoxin, partial [Nitrosotalea sp.]
VMESLAVMAAENPFGFGQLLNTIYTYLQKPVEITLINSVNEDIKNYLLKKFIPEAILVMISKKEDLESLQNLQFFTGKEFDDTKTQVYVCRDFTCSLPLGTVSEIEKLV